MKKLLLIPVSPNLTWILIRRLWLDILETYLLEANMKQC